MILDTSAVVAIVMKEPGYEELLQRMASSDPAIGTATLAETAIVPFGESHCGAAVDAWLRYGKGRHPAALNFGDCLSYTVARLANEPLLFVGDDFALTDIART